MLHMIELLNPIRAPYNESVIKEIEMEGQLQ